MQAGHNCVCCIAVATDLDQCLWRHCAQLLWRYTLLNFCGDTLCSTSVATHIAQLLWRHTLLNFCGDTLCSTSVATHFAELLWRHTLLNFCGDTLCSTSVATHFAQPLWRHTLLKALFVTAPRVFWTQCNGFWQSFKQAVQFLNCLLNS